MNSLTGDRRSGFTLIELSIVLVVIGLLVGGVLTGRDLVKAAEMRRVINETDKFATAIFAFKAKYGCLPGDCVNGNALFANSGSGNNNGRIDPSTGVGNCGDLSVAYCVRPQGATASGGIEEVTLANEHLAKAQLITLAPFNSRTDTPPDDLSNTWFYSLRDDPGIAVLPLTDSAGENVLRLGAQQWWIYYMFWTASSMEPEEAYAIDGKIDDGLPMTGNVVNGQFVATRHPGNPYATDGGGCQVDNVSVKPYGANRYNIDGSRAITQRGPCGLSVYGKY